MSFTEADLTPAPEVVLDDRIEGEPITTADEVLRRVVPLGKSKASEPAVGAFIPSVNTSSTASAPVPSPGPIGGGEMNPTTSAFIPSGPGSRDNGGLSTHRECKPAREAYEDYISEDRAAIGTWGFPVDAARRQDLPVFDDGGIDDRPETHATVWFPDVSNEPKRSRRAIYERLGLELHNAATCLYRPA
ncbi:hypothetical protein GS876_23535 [Rhodococcus hoagii]|nr:hypothetical protein [Prescottella equi]MBM4581024.1 hypothetical protein [Prescottella equi]MBM4685647.1 hypothetical protein [Prescottella equi]NKU31539.1 hypothetical protein [Prescottella equi]NKU32254.1 hypothetical protein [Prescottella equi]